MQTKIQLKGKSLKTEYFAVESPARFFSLPVNIFTHGKRHLCDDTLLEIVWSWFQLMLTSLMTDMFWYSFIWLQTQLLLVQLFSQGHNLTLLELFPKDGASAFNVWLIFVITLSGFSLWKREFWSVNAGGLVMYFFQLNDSYKNFIDYNFINQSFLSEISSFDTWHQVLVVRLDLGFVDHLLNVCIIQLYLHFTMWKYWHLCETYTV